MAGTPSDMSFHSPSEGDNSQSYLSPKRVTPLHLLVSTLHLEGTGHLELNPELCGSTRMRKYMVSQLLSFKNEALLPTLFP